MTENFPILVKERHTGPRSTECPIQGKPKEKHAKTHINHLRKIKQIEKILKAQREKQQITRESP